MLILATYMLLQALLFNTLETQNETNFKIKSSYNRLFYIKTSYIVRMFITITTYLH